MAAASTVVRKREADFCGTRDKFYIVRSDLGEYLESSDCSKGTDLDRRNLHPDCRGGDHYLSYLSSFSQYFIVISGDHFRRVKDLSKAADKTGDTRLHEKCRGGDFYLGTNTNSFFSRTSFTIIFSAKGVYRVVSDLRTAKDLKEYKLHDACKGGMYYWATKNKNVGLRYYLVKQEAGELRFHCTNDLKNNSSGPRDAQTFHPLVMEFLMMFQAGEYCLIPYNLHLTP